ncbi:MULTISPECIES: hypothetical protein [Clostridium]|uniref:hypothetical protein n=1 Tax=Clostridium TaxID=1485 RepID=UPI0003B58DD4|nr:MULTISPECIES: hypothetical protein [Clostridium]MDY4607278.1 hypothetical protein [Clostridium tertium]
MTNQKTGTSMSNIIVTKKATDKRMIEIKKSNARKKRAAICIECESNNDGYCKKYSEWCGRVNYICLGIKDPYEYKIPKPKKSSQGKKKKKRSSKANKPIDKKCKIE